MFPSSDSNHHVADVYFRVTLTQIVVKIDDKDDIGRFVEGVVAGRVTLQHSVRNPKS